MILCLLSGHILRLFLIMPDLKKCYLLIFSSLTPPKINMDTKHDALENVSPFKNGPFRYPCILNRFPKNCTWTLTKEAAFGSGDRHRLSRQCTPPLTCAWVDQLPSFSFRDKLINIIVGFTMLYIRIYLYIHTKYT